jgi:hypothetical protein
MEIRGGHPSSDTAASVNEVLRTIGNLPRRKPTRDLHVAFKIPYIQDVLLNLCRQEAAGIQNYENLNCPEHLPKGSSTQNIKGSNLVAVRHTTVQVSKLLLYP